MAVKVLEVHLVGDGVSLDRALSGSAKTAAVAATKMEAAGTRMVAAGKRISSTGKSMTRGLTLPLVAVGALAVKTAFDFEKSMSLISTEAGGTRKEVDHLEKSVLKLARASQWSPNQLATGLYHIESSGYRGAKAMDILNVSQKLATAGNSELEETTYALVSAVRALGTEGIGPTNKVAAELNAIIGHGDMRLQELVQALSSGVIPTAVTAGMGLRDVGAALDIMTSRGEPAQMAATRLRMTISLLSAPTDKAKKALKEVGIASLDLAHIMRKEGIGPAVAFLAEHLERVSKTQANVILSSAFGGGRSSGAIKTLVLNAEELIEKEEDIGKGVHNYNREVREAENRNMTKMKEAWSSIQADLVEIGKAVGPPVLKVFQEVSHTIAGLTKSFTGLDKGTQGWIIKAAAAFAIGGPILLGVGKLISGWGKLVILFGKAARALELITAAETTAAAVGTAGIATGVAATGAASIAKGGGLLGPRGTPIYEELGIAGGAGGAGAAVTGTEATAAAGGAGGLLGGVFKSSGGVKGAGRVLGRAVLAAAAGYITAEIGVHALKAFGVGDPTEGQGIFGGLTHGFNTSKMGHARTEQEGGELTHARLFEIHPKLSVPDAKKISATYQGLMRKLSGDSILGMKTINFDMRQGLRAANALWATNTPQWHHHAANAMQQAVHSIKAGMKAGTIPVQEGKKQINQLLREIRLVKGDDPLGLAKETVKSFREAKGITSKGVRQLVQEFELMPKGAREASQNTTLQMLHQWAQGHPKIEAQVQGLTKNLLTKFGATNKQLREGVKHGATGPVAEAFKGLAGGVAGSLQNIGVNTQQVLKALGVKNIPQFQITLATGGGSKFSPPEGGVGFGREKHQTGGAVGFTVPGTGTGDIFATALPPNSFVLNRKATEHFGFQTGGHVPVALEPKERVFMPHEVDRIGLGTLTAMNSLVQRFQQGGLAIPHPYLTGGTDPLRQGGQKVIDKGYHGATAYIRKHSEPPRILHALHAMEAQAHKGYPYVFGGGHGGFHGPFDCSGFVSYGLHAAGFINAPLSVQQGSGLYTLGAPGPGKFLTWGVRGTSGANAHTMMAIKKPGNKGWGYFESGGSGGGAHESSGWDGSFQFRHMPGYQQGGAIQALKDGGKATPVGKNLRHDFDKAIHRIWPRAAAYYGRSAGAMPSTLVMDLPSGAGATVRLKHGKTAIVDRNAALGVAYGHEPGMIGVPAGKGTLLHEWAHVFQTPGLRTWEAEGGAEDFKRWAGPAIFGKTGAFGPRTLKYSKYAESVLKNKGWNWVKHGQFGFQQGGRVPGRAQEAIGRYGADAFNPKSKHFVGWGYQRGGRVKLQSGGNPMTVTGKISYEGGTGHMTADGKHTDEDPGFAIRDDSTLGDWFWASAGGRQGLLQHIDWGPAASTGRSIDFTAAGLRKIGSPLSITDTYGSVEWKGHTVAEAGRNLGNKAAAAARKKEKIPAMFGQAHTGSIDFPSIPKNLEGIKRLIAIWTHKLEIYKREAKKAAKKSPPGTQQAIEKNIVAIRKFLKDLRLARKKAHVEVVKKNFKKRLTHKLGKITGYETAIEKQERVLEEAEQESQQYVDLEPTQPNLPDSASDKEREDSEKAFETEYKQYIEGKERPSYQKVLDIAGALRNTILRAEIFGFDKDKPSADEMERGWEKRVRTLTSIIDRIEKLKRPEKGTKAYKHYEEQIARLPMLKFKQHELEETVGAARESFFLGGDNRINPPAPPAPLSGTFEDALVSLQGVHGMDQHKLISPLPVIPVAGQFGGSIFDTQLTIKELGLKIAEASSSGSGGGTDEADSAKLEVANELLRREREKTAALEANAGVLASLGNIGPKPYKQSYPWAGRYAKGGMVAALFGETGPEIGVTPEGTNVATASQTEALLTPHVEVNNHHYPDHTETEVLINGKEATDAIINEVAATLGTRANHRAQGVSDGTTGTL